MNIPVKVFPATEIERRRSPSTSFTASARRASSRRSWCPHCEREVPNSEIVKGYEFEKGRYVVMSEEDIDKVRPESTRVIDLVQFADDSSIDPMYVDRTYYLAPDGGVASDAFAVMREGMKGKVGHRQAGALRPRVSGRRPSVRARHRHAHAAPRRGNPQHRLGRGTELGADEGEARGNQAGQAGHRHVRGAARISPTTRTSTAKGCSGSSTRRSPARRSSRRRSRRRPRSST